jgi:hypothetical protein
MVAVGETGVELNVGVVVAVGVIGFGLGRGRLEFGVTVAVGNQ